MDSKIQLKLIVDNYIRVCYIIPDYVDMRKTKDKNPYTNYFNSLISFIRNNGRLLFK